MKICEMSNIKGICFVALIFPGIFLYGCQAQRSTLNMVTDPQTGLKFGSVVEKSIFIDADQFVNKKIKVSTRNTSGDLAFGIRQFRAELERAYEAKGYFATRKNFGLKIDLNILYSGHIRSDLSSTYGFLGAAAGGIIGARSRARGGAAIGLLAGATIGSIIGNTQTRDTYITISEIAVGIAEAEDIAKTTKSITFGSSPKLQEERKSAFKPFREVLRSRIAVYGGGTNVSQGEVAEKVRRRLIRIVSDAI